MKKLIELLNERLQTSDLYDFYDKIYYKEYCGGNVVKIMARIRDKLKPTGDRDADMTHLICLKKYEFIKRLVDNDKIDRKRVSEKNKNGYDITRVNPDDNYIDSMDSYADEADLYLLMLLAISDTPIDFLCSILK